MSVRYHAAFWGRANGAIGIAHRCNRSVTVEGDVDSVSTRQAVQRALYDTHEHISNVVLTVISDDDSVPKGAA